MTTGASRSRLSGGASTWLCRSRSLPLLKATGAVPHSGGRRFKKDSEYYRTLLRWIEAGAPELARRGWRVGDLERAGRLPGRHVRWPSGHGGSRQCIHLWTTDGKQIGVTPPGNALLTKVTASRDGGKQTNQILLSVGIDLQDEGL